MITPIPDPTLVLRLVKGAPLTFAEGDDNLTNLANFVEALQTLLLGIIGTSLNEDGTLAPGSVGIQALQAASVSYAALNPGTLYSILPVNADTGTVQNAYQLTTLGGSGSITNLVPPGAQYNANGQYTLSGLTPNAAYAWTPKSGGNDLGLTQGTTGLTGTSPATFISYGTTAILTGTPNDTVTAMIQQSAYVTAYQNGQIYFVSTFRSNTGPSTLQVNNLSAVPMLYYGAQLQAGQIGANGVFAVVYMNGVFWVFGGATPPASAQGGGTTVITTTGFNGITTYTAPSTALATSGFPNAVLQAAHGLGGTPTQFEAVLVCNAADSGFEPGQEVSLGQFTNNGSGPAFVATFDSIYFYVTQLSAASVINPGTGSLVAITPSKWSLSVEGSVISDYSGTSVFPALTYEVANPHSAWCYGTNLFYISQDTLGNSGLYYINQVNMLNNEITPINQVSTPIGYANGAVFAGSFFGLTIPQFVFDCSGGTYRLPAQNPGTNSISPDTSYSSSGTVTVTLATAGNYTWTPGTNDVEISGNIAYGTGNNVTIQATSTVNGQIQITTVSPNVTVTLTGSPNTVLTGTIISLATSWLPVEISAIFPNSFDYKPAWVGSSGAVVYLASSGRGQAITAINCYQVTASTVLLNGAWATNNSAALNLTNSSIVGTSGFTTWYPSTSTASALLFQYNPITQRIYLITDEMSVIHIFKLTTASNDFSLWWNTASPAREQALTYVKSLALAGMGRNMSVFAQAHYTIDYDPVSGKERALVFTRDGANGNIGSITRVPWVE